MYDIIIVGGGPAGLTAAVYALRAGKSVVVIEKNSFGGQIAFSPKVENIPGTISISGSEFAEQLVEQAMNLGADVELETVTDVRKDGDVFKVSTEEGSTFEGKAVILAVGVKHRMLGLEGEQELIGNGISFCAVCDGAFYTGQEVAMIGGGNSAMQEALLLSEVCKKVTIVQNLADFTGEKKLAQALSEKENVEVFFSTVVDGYESVDGSLIGLHLLYRYSGGVCCRRLPQQDHSPGGYCLCRRCYRRHGCLSVFGCLNKITSLIITRHCEPALAGVAILKVSGMSGGLPRRFAPRNDVIFILAPQYRVQASPFPSSRCKGQ